jgi:hypothetical protein
MSFWEFSSALTRRLMQWSMVSAALGLLMSTRGGFWSGVGSQFIGWAAVNLGITFFGTQGTNRRRQRLGDAALQPAVNAREARGLRRLLLINAGLDVLYMVGGLVLMRRDGERTRGAGLGIVLQGAFLFGFDLYHAAAIEQEVGLDG